MDLAVLDFRQNLGLLAALVVLLIPVHLVYLPVLVHRYPADLDYQQNLGNLVRLDVLVVLVHQYPVPLGSLVVLGIR